VVVLGSFDTLKNFLSSKPSKGTSLGESLAFEVYNVKTCPPISAVGDEKKK